MNQTASHRKSLLASARGTKEPQKASKFRKGTVTNTGANLQPPRPDVNAGRVEKENVKFLEDFQKFVFGKEMLQDQYQEAEKERGVAQFEKANADQREAFKNAITNGWIDSKESPYFRQKVTELYTKELLTKTSLELYTNYEKWEGKNDPSSGAFANWLQGQDELIAPNLETIPDSILADHFYEPHQGLKRQLAQKHAEYLNKEYKDKANDYVDVGFKRLVGLYAEPMGLQDKKYVYENGGRMSYTDRVIEEGGNEALARKVTGILQTAHPNDRILSKSSLEKLELLAFEEGSIAYLTLEKYLKKHEKKEVLENGTLKSYLSNKYGTTEDKKLLKSEITETLENLKFNNPDPEIEKQFISTVTNTKEGTKDKSEAPIKIKASSLEGVQGNNSTVFTDVYMSEFATNSEFFEKFAQNKDRYKIMNAYMAKHYSGVFSGTPFTNNAEVTSYQVSKKWKDVEISPANFRAFIMDYNN
jgi:hypothetical protein